MVSACLADISFFNSINGSESRSFVWNGTQSSFFGVHNQVGLFSILNGTVEEKQNGENVPNNTATEEDINSGNDPLDKLEKAVKEKTKKKNLRKFLGTLGLLTALTVGSSAAQVAAVKHFYPEEYAARQQNASVAQQGADYFNHPYYYSHIIADNPWVGHVEMVRRVLEGKLAGPGLGVALAYLLGAAKQMAGGSRGTQKTKKSGLTEQQKKELETAFKTNDFSKVAEYFTEKDIDTARVIAAFNPRLLEGLNTLVAASEKNNPSHPESAAKTKRTDSKSTRRSVSGESKTSSRHNTSVKKSNITKGPKASGRNYTLADDLRERFGKGNNDIIKKYGQTLRGLKNKVKQS